MQHPAAEWRRMAAVLRQHDASAQAMVYEQCAVQLEAWLREQGAELLNLTQAGLRSGYSPDSLRRMIKKGRLANYGRPHAPRVAAGDLPRKALRPATLSRHVEDASRQKARVSTMTPRGGS